MRSRVPLLEQQATRSVLERQRRSHFGNPPGRYCPSCICVISTAPHFSASGGRRKMEESNP
ncbi:MAG: hypothetical protein RMY34_10730 [Aulosira sp. DedQUE10]|nr:hypothetical protein [Aulosira sp. DedQUE10]